MMDREYLNYNEMESDLKKDELRPRILKDFIGQDKLKSNLYVFLNSAKKRNTVLDHVLLYGPPGLGKTTLATIIANEMNSEIHSTAGPLLQKVGDLAAIISNLKDGDILFIDEIHRIPKSVEELLYSAMEDFHMDIIVGEGVGARTLKIDTAKFTLVGATTRAGLLSKPLQDRFGILLNLDFYSLDALTDIIIRCSNRQNIGIDKEAAYILSKSSRGTPRIALRLFRRVEDFMIAKGSDSITADIIRYALLEIGVDAMGLDVNDRKYLDYLLRNKEQAIGIETMAAALSEHKNNLEEIVEPYLIQIGFILKTGKGRMLTDSAIEYLERK